MIIFNTTLTNSHYVIAIVCIIVFYTLGCITGYFYRKLITRPKKFISIRTQLKESYDNLKEAAEKIRELDELFYRIEKNG